MPTVRDIITRAMAKAKVISSGEVPTADEMQDGLTEFVSMFEQWATGGMFGRLTDVYESGSYEAEPGQRITLTDGGTATLPDYVEDDEQRAPYDLSYIEIIDRDAQTVERHLYEGGQWVAIHDLGLDDPAPLSSRGSGGLSACLAMILADEFGGEVGLATMRQAAAFKTSLSLKLGGSAERTAATYF